MLRSKPLIEYFSQSCHTIEKGDEGGAPILVKYGGEVGQNADDKRLQFGANDRIIF